MNEKSSAASNRLRSLCAVALLAPALRLIPGLSARFAGKLCWLSVIAAIPFLVLDIWFLSAFMKNRAPGEGMTDMLYRALGSGIGRAAAGIFGLWFMFYCGFLLRSGADRFISTVYPVARPETFSFIMLALGLLAALGRDDSLFRTAKVFRPIELFVLGLTLLLALTTVNVENLLPVTGSDVVPVLKGAVPLVEVACTILTIACFFEGRTEKTPHRFKNWCVWTILPLAMTLLLCAATVGNFGGELTANLNYPFFAMVRNVHILRSVERIEAFVVALWVLPDFVLVSLLLTAASKTFMSVFGYRPVEGARLTDMKNGRYFIPLCAVAAGAVSVVIAPNSFALEKFSEMLVPAVNIGLIFVFLPLCFIVGKLRKKI